MKNKFYQWTMGNEQGIKKIFKHLSFYHPLSFFRFFIFCLLPLAFSCNAPYTPKPRGYFKINFPQKKYQQFNFPGYPYTFEYPIYATITKDSSFFGETTENPWWININFPIFNGRIYVSYKKIEKNNFGKLLNDVFALSNKQSSKAYSIDDSLFITPDKIHGVFFKIGGDVATANQFFLTDSSKNFFRGALYFNATPNEDSLKIVNDFLLEDMKHLINTFKWKDR